MPRFSKSVRVPYSKLQAFNLVSEIDYEFRNVLIAMLAAANHDIAVDRIMSAFLVEAQNRYGQAPIASAPE